MALTVMPQKPDHFLQIESDPPGGDIWVKCEMCGDVGGHHQDTIREVRLTDSNKQRPAVN